MNNTVHDLIAIGIGPFNLGMAALIHPVKNIKALFLEKNHSFNWHPGILIPGTTLQVPYLADLVSLADPSSPFSYLNYLRKQNRLLQFGIRQEQHITRTEYNRYCRWVCQQLDNLLFDQHVETVEYDTGNDCYRVHCKDGKSNNRFFYARKIVIGTGSVPALPACVSEQQISPYVFHSCNYLLHQKKIEDATSITIVGSGQSAAEIYFDLLCNHPEKKLYWFTRSDRFYAMEDHKLIYEMNTPDYIHYFHGLKDEHKKNLLKIQHSLYKGINKELLNAIYDKLYEQKTETGETSSVIKPDVTLELLEKRNNNYHLEFHHRRLDQLLVHQTNCVILATGYQTKLPEFIGPLKEHISWLSDGNYMVNDDYSVDTHHSVFVQNAEMHTHGFNAADLSLGPYRNAVIINAILGKEHYPIDLNITFQQFGLAVD
jgi:lysine N6-hydroxylase